KQIHGRQGGREDREDRAEQEADRERIPAKPWRTGCLGAPYKEHGKQGNETLPAAGWRTGCLGRRIKESTGRKETKRYRLPVVPDHAGLRAFPAVPSHAPGGRTPVAAPGYANARRWRSTTPSTPTRMRAACSCSRTVSSCPRWMRICWAWKTGGHPTPP